MVAGPMIFLSVSNKLNLMAKTGMMDLHFGNGVADGGGVVTDVLGVLSIGGQREGDNIPHAARAAQVMDWLDLDQ